MALVSMFLCNQSYASHGRDFLLGATILNFNGRTTAQALDPVFLRRGTTMTNRQSCQRRIRRQRKGTATTMQSKQRNGYLVVPHWSDQPELFFQVRAIFILALPKCAEHFSFVLLFYFWFLFVSIWNSFGISYWGFLFLFLVFYWFLSCERTFLLSLVSQAIHALVKR